jgi:flagellar hook-associated protein 3 FlgL
MRVTNQSISFQVIDGLQRAFQRVAQTQEAVTTGRRINHLSDDPLAAARVFSLRSASASLDQYEKNINAALPALEQGDSALSDLGDLLARAKELALSMANDSNSPEQRLITVKEVRNLFEQVLAVANTKVDNRYIFAGFVNGAPPFSEGAGAVAYSGDNGQIQVHTSASGSLATNIPGDQIFQGAGVANGVDIFDVFLKLDSALQNNDLDGPNGIRSQLGRIDSAVDQVLSFRAEFGARTNSAQSAKDAIGMLKVKSTEQRSQLEDADAIAAYSDLARYQQAFQAALQSASQLIQPSLLDFLR